MNCETCSISMMDGATSATVRISCRTAVGCTFVQGIFLFESLSDVCSSAFLGQAMQLQLQGRIALLPHSYDAGEVSQTTKQSEM